MVDRLRLVRTDGVGPVTYRRLLERFADPAAAIDALPRLARAGGRRAPIRVPPADAIERELEQVRRFGARMLLLGDPDYPALLAITDTAPPALCVHGDPAALSGEPIALVGARNASANGKHMAELLAHDMATAGFTVVSGMARGIDTAAHVGALRGGRTVACIAGGIDVAYPEENAELQRRVAAGGAVIAEAPFGTAPQARHFPRRNRVIAGLSRGVIVVEAAPRSGSLITARMAAEIGRELFAVPGSPLDPRCRGSNDLIRNGARLVESAADVAAELTFLRPALPPARAAELPGPRADAPADDAELRRIVLENLAFDPVDIDVLITACALPAGNVNAALLELELGGVVETLAGHRVVRVA